MAEKQLGSNPSNDKDIATKKYVDDAVAGGGGGGDASTNTSSSVVNEIALFADTGGKTLKRSSGNGVATLTSGVLGTTSTTGSGNVVLATSPTLVTPALGTPSALTLTNATGLPVAGITASTSTALGVGSVELGHATDTTLSRSSAGQLAVEGVTVSMNSTSAIHTASTIELGHASDTTLSRSASGTLAVEGVDVLTTSNAKTVTNKTLTNPTVNNYVEGTVAIGTVTTASTIDLTNGTVQTATLTASTACTFTMPTAGAGKSFVLYLKQAASTGNGTATFTSVKWPTAGAPTITATAGKMDILSFVSDGTNWYGSYVQGYTP